MFVAIGAGVTGLLLLLGTSYCIHKQKCKKKSPDEQRISPSDEEIRAGPSRTHNLGYREKMPLNEDDMVCADIDDMKRPDPPPREWTAEGGMKNPDLDNNEGRIFGTGFIPKMVPLGGAKSLPPLPSLAGGVLSSNAPSGNAANALPVGGGQMPPPAPFGGGPMSPPAPFGGGPGPLPAPFGGGTKPLPAPLGGVAPLNDLKAFGGGPMPLPAPFGGGTKPLPAPLGDVAPLNDLKAFGGGTKPLRAPFGGVAPLNDLKPLSDLKLPPQLSKSPYGDSAKGPLRPNHRVPSSIGQRTPSSIDQRAPSSIGHRDRTPTPVVVQTKMESNGFLAPVDN